jgi:SAM-dependent methyltransferase
MGKQKNNNHDYYGHYWNDNMISYLSRSAGGRWSKYLLNEILKDIPKSSVKTIADVGCGVGMKTAQMANYFKKAKVNGYDFSESGIEAAKNFHNLKNLDFSTDDITTTVNKRKFDLIASFDFLEHIKDWEPLVKKLIQANNRYMLICAPIGRMRAYEPTIGHYRNFQRDQIEVFMEANGYKTLKTFYAGFPFYSPILRDLTNHFYKSYSETPQTKMGFMSRRMHDVWYFLFRYCSSNKIGDNFIGLFEKTSTNPKSTR